MQLELAKIRLEDGTQPRAQLSSEVINDYAEQMRMGAKFPPIVVFYDGKDYWLADGFHRVVAAKKARLGEPIEAEVMQGTQSDAQWYSYGVNKTHGLRRTNEDKARAVKRALCHPQGARRSDREIAWHVGVTGGMVGKYRAALEATCQIDRSTNRTGSDGRTINTTHIGRARRQAKSRSHSGARRSSLKPIRPMIAPSVVEQMTAPSLPLNPVMGARALLSVFGKGYLRIMVDELIRCLKEDAA
jgi:hypothetical protein